MCGLPLRLLLGCFEPKLYERRNEHRLNGAAETGESDALDLKDARGMTVGGAQYLSYGTDPQSR